MNRIVSAYTLAGTVFLCLGGTMASAQTAPAKVAEERKEIMEKLWPSYYRDISQVARGQSTDLSAVPAKAAQAAEALKKFGTLFPAGSGREGAPKTRAKPEIWSQRAEFDAALNALITETVAIGEAAKSGNADAVKARWQPLVQACGGCHGGPPKSGGKFRFEEM